MEFTDLPELYSSRFDEREMRRKNEIWIEVTRFLQRFISPSDVLVDVGCGSGEFINNIKAARKIGVDMNPESVLRLSTDVEFHNISGKEIAGGGIESECADVLFTSNFLEHLPDKATLESFFIQVKKTLKSGGKFIIMGPNLRYIPGAYWDFYDHNIGLTHLSLIEALQLRGFAIEKCYDKFLPYTTKTALPTHPLLVKLYLLFPPIWRLLGKQFLVIAIKKA